MNLQSLKLKASTLCAGGTLLVFGGFLTVNLAGCGGGGGGGLTTVPTPRPVGATFRIIQQDGTPSQGGSVTLTGNGQTYNGTADNTGVAVIPGVAPGNYTVTFSTIQSNGTALPSTSRPLSITRSGAQNYVLVQGDVGKGPNSIIGTIFTNPSNGATRACTATSTPFTGSVLVSVRDLNDTTGSPIIAQITRPAQANAAVGARGRYSISIPTLSGQHTFRVEVGPADNNGVQIAGVSATTTFTEGNNTLTNVDVCANLNGTIPAPVETPTPTPEPSRTPPFGIPTNTPTTAPTVDPTQAPQATATAAAQATAMVNATATAGPAATMSASATATAVAGGGTTAVTTGGTTVGGTVGGTTVSTTTAGGTAGGSTGQPNVTPAPTPNLTGGGTTGAFTAGNPARTRR